MSEAGGSLRQSNRFLILYTLAAAGGSVAYAPFLTLLLPMQVNARWGAEALHILSYCAFAGAVAASLANIFFGWLSDRTGMRRIWIVLGLGLANALLILMPFADNMFQLIGIIVLWQVALNMMLNPLMALAGDYVPDEQKGTLGGLLAFSPAGGAMAGAFITMPSLAEGSTRFVLVACICIAMVLPVVIFGKPVPMPHLMQTDAENNKADNRLLKHADKVKPTGKNIRKIWAMRKMWLARLLVQLGEAALFAFLLLWFISLDSSLDDSFTARLFTLVLFVSVPLAFLVGRWSDRHGRPIMPLIMLAGGTACGLLIIAFAATVAAGVTGYIICGVMAGVFLALHSSQTLRVLPSPENRGRDLGFFNLTNTVPSLIMPWLALALVPVFGFRGLFMALAGLCVLACILLKIMQTR